MARTTGEVPVEVESIRLTHLTQPSGGTVRQLPAREDAEEIYVKAINSDNHRDVEGLIKLFQNNYGISYPVSQVYEPSFWSARLDGDEENEECPGLISIVAVHGSRFVAHLALKKACFGEQVEILLPAVHPAYRKEVFRIGRLFWARIADLAKRQQWKLVFHYSLLSHPVSQLIANKCFQSLECALIPNYIPPKDLEIKGMRRPDERTSLLVMCNVFNTEQSDHLSLFPPEHHVAIIEKLYEPLGLSREIYHTPKVDKNWAKKKDRMRGRLRETRVTASHNAELDFDSFTVVPSEISSIDNLTRCIKEMTGSCARRAYIQVALNDPHCPHVCQALESMGYRFCGVLPLVDERDYILYAKFDNTELEELTLYSRRAKALRDYLVSPREKASFSLH